MLTYIFFLLTLESTKIYGNWCLHEYFKLVIIDHEYAELNAEFGANKQLQFYGWLGSCEKSLLMEGTLSSTHFCCNTVFPLQCDSWEMRTAQEQHEGGLV